VLAMAAAWCSSDLTGCRGEHAARPLATQVCAYCSGCALLWLMIGIWWQGHHLDARAAGCCWHAAVQAPLCRGLWQEPTVQGR
jgi:hypothetical protein